jgi:hypothetical protein
MNKKLRILIIEKLRDFSCRLAAINKEIASVNVSDLLLVREDLEGPHKKKRSHVAHGQKQNEPTSSNRITPPAGMGIHSDSPVVAPFYQELSQ